MGGYKYRKILVLVGGTHTGKTTTMNVLVAMIEGRPVRKGGSVLKNVYTASMQQLSQEIFERYKLIGKYANVCDDMSNEAIKQMGFLKQLSGGSPISVRDLYHSGFSTYNSAKLVFACNETPYTDTRDLAWWDRIIVMPFITPHPEGDPKTILDVDEKIMREELSGVLNWAIRGAMMLEKRRSFVEVSVDEKRALWDAFSGDPLGMFVADKVVCDGSAEKIYTEEVYKRYQKYCMTYPSRRVYSPKEFWARFSKLVLYKRGQDSHGAREHWVKGFSMKD